MSALNKNNTFIISKKALIIFSLFCLSFIYVRKKSEHIALVKNYYEALNNADESLLDSMLVDSIITFEADYNYKYTFSKSDYLKNWLVWDTAFEPHYEILKITEDHQKVYTKVSKTDKRILFLHEEPIVWNAIISFNENKIASIHRKYVHFNDSLWNANRRKLITWVDENHLELNGFLEGQNAGLAKKYLKAIELYQTYAEN